MAIGTLHISAILIILVGAILLFAGWRIYKGLITLFGFIIGAMCGAALMAVLSPTLVFTVIGVIIGGIIGAVLFRFVNFAVFPILGGMLGVVVAQMLMFPADSGFLYWVVVIAFAAGGALLGLIFRKFVVIATTCLIGSALMVGGIVQLVTGTRAIEAMHLKYLQTSQLDTTVMIGIIVLAILGAIVQLSTSKKQHEKKCVVKQTKD